MNNKEKSSSKVGIVLVFFSLIILAVFLTNLDKRGSLNQVRGFIQGNYSLPVKNVATLPRVFYDKSSAFFISQYELLKENESQKKEIAWLKASLTNQSVLEAENRRLKLLLESSAEHTRPVVIAEVVDSYINATKHQIEINKGEDDLVFIGQIATDEKGVIGQITTIYPKTSIVSLITDARQRIPVFIERNRVRAVLSGIGDLSELEVEFMDLEADIKVGDRLITSGFGKRFPKGYQIGDVTNVDNSAVNSFSIVKVKPLAALDKVLEVLLIVPEINEETKLEEQEQKNDNK